MIVSTTDEQTGRFKRALKRFTATSAEIEADALLQESEHQGCRKIGDLKDRELISVLGHLKTVCLAPRAGTPTLEADLYDGSGVLTLVWLGRRRIAGIKPGVSLLATGRVSCHEGRRVIFNPRYELRS